MNLRPFFSYYGGKWRAAPRYPAPIHRMIVEPFAGSAGYATRYPDRDVLLVDINPKVVEVWKYIIGSTAAEIRALPDVVDEIPAGLPQEARWLIGFWLNHGSQRPCERPSRWMREGKWRDSFWGPAIRERVASQAEHIRHWRATLGSYADPRFVGNVSKTTWFVDPPYCGPAGRHYDKDALDYEHLGRWCRALKGQVIVCEGPGATWLPFREFGTTSGTSRRGILRPKRSMEQIWTNDV